MIEDPKSFPVRYMVVKACFGGYNVIDTCFPNFEVECKSGNIYTAHRIAKLMNEAEGYRYDLS